MIKTDLMIRFDETGAGAVSLDAIEWIGPSRSNSMTLILLRSGKEITTSATVDEATEAVNRLRAGRCPWCGYEVELLASFLRCGRWPHEGHDCKDRILGRESWDERKPVVHPSEDPAP